MKLYLKVKNLGSKSARELAKALSEELGYKVLRSRFDLSKRKALCYGQGVNKLAQYEFFQKEGIPALEFTTDPGIAHDWFFEEGNTVIGRKTLTGQCGSGIEVYDDPVDWDTGGPCLVYTKYKKKKREFRVHVFRDQVVAILEKKLKKGWNGPKNSKVRNHKNGYVFCQVAEGTVPAGLREIALEAADVSASDFQGVDIGFNEAKQELFVIEVNSGPGIEGSNIGKYVQAILA